MFISILSFLYSDWSYYKCGYGGFIFKKSLPYGFKPSIYYRYPYYFSFNRAGIEHAAEGSSLEEYKIKRILAYGYNDSSIIVKYKDSLDVIRYSVSKECKYAEESNVNFTNIDNQVENEIKNSYQWYHVDKDLITMLLALKITSVLGMILSSLVLLACSLLKIHKK